MIGMALSMPFPKLLTHLLLVGPLVTGLRYDPDQVGFNLNENQTASHPLDYWGEWKDHEFMPSPSNWRMPFYTVMLDRFANGNPLNDDANGTQFEHDLTQTQLRHGGDIEGLKDSLDYLQGMGIKALYLAGSPHINVPWASDGYSPLDLTLLDHHFGNIEDWRAAIAEVHKRGMYVVLDNTMSTMGDLIGFEGYLNTSTPYDRNEHDALWKSDRRYHDFSFGNNELAKCEYPRFYGDDGIEVTNLTTELVGCRDSDFDQYGEIAAFDNYPEWQRQISKFAFVQDRLREWRPDVLARIEHFACITIAMLDIDGYRMDKGLMITVDAQAHWSDAMRKCARRFGKDNFYISGEIVSGNTFGAVYIGRGKSPDNYVTNVTQAIAMTNESDPKYFIRDVGQSAFDGAAFHYTVYRSLNRFLGLDGEFAADGDPPVDWVDFWQTMIQTNDLTNANTGKFDPRHMYGVTNQDVFRWPGLQNGTAKQLLGMFITTLLLPGIPTLYWGEEQSLYVLDSTAANYVFGRSPMSSAQAWGMHGCYKVGNSKYYNWPLDAAIYGCEDASVNLDHRDPSHPVRNIIKSMHEMRENYPALNDGFSLLQLSNQTRDVFLPGSAGAPTETGMWSMQRAGFVGFQELNQSVWLVYQNDNQTVPYKFNCSNPKRSLISPFAAKETVKNLYFPFEEYVLERSTSEAGCLSELQLPAWGYKAFVPKGEFKMPSPVITQFIPGHDFRQLTVAPDGDTIHIELHFSVPMDCNNLKASILINSTTANNQTAQLDGNSVVCKDVSSGASPLPLYSGGVNTTWTLAANLTNVANGIHAVTVNNASTADGKGFTKSVDRFLLRIGQADNPMVFPMTANYSSSMLHKDEANTLYISHKAPGADQFRYSLDFGTTYTAWEAYGKGENTTLAPKNWSGTKLQAWKGEHVIVQYWGRLAGSSDHVQHADLDAGEDLVPRRFPHIFLQGPFNQYGFDDGLRNQMKMEKTGVWKATFMTEWPAPVSFNIWGMNPDGQPDQTAIYGDIDGDYILDRIPLKSLITNAINITGGPPSPYLAYEIALNDADLRFFIIPVGNRWAQMAMYVLLWVIPVLTAFLGVWLFMKSFYQVKFNKIGISEHKSIMPLAFRRKFRNHKLDMQQLADKEPSGWDPYKSNTAAGSAVSLPAPLNLNDTSFPVDPTGPSRRTVLIATMEYDIEDWNIKIKIGGLGVMAQLMGKNLAHQDLIWVVPCVGGIDYPIDEPADTMTVTILGNVYEIQVQYHVLRNITYVLLDAPVFRQQTKSEPYPPRMDDLDSAVYYSAWNQCIAEVMRRFPVDLYHINDYHGAVAPLHLLPHVIPCVLSLHNAEFQGLWPMRSVTERDEVCRVYNLDAATVGKYVQFGEVFNLLHAGASYLRVHQKGFGAVGVSAKYGKRSFARYPILWGLKEVGSLPNPDPTDTAEWNKAQVKPEDIHVDPVFEAQRPGLKRQAQEWANLEIKPDADLFVFVGRWSQQKGVDLIADVFPSILEANPQVQLICVGPMIDLYGKFAALKLDRMMKVYPGRVYSKPEFTALPPYIFSGADFALMPSRDEPFGLVAVEFGRKGALCVGARVGGLGQMPGWWFTVESTTSKHLINQFKIAIEGALKSKPEMRATMRARAAKQRFPVAQWVEDLEKLQSTAITINQKQLDKGGRLGSSWNTPIHSRRNSLTQTRPTTPTFATLGQSRAPSPDGHREGPLPKGSLGKRKGPGHRKRKRLSKRNISSPLSPITPGTPQIEESSDEGDGYETDEDAFTPGHSRIQSRTHSRRHSRNPSQMIKVTPPIPIVPSDDRLPTLPFALQGASPLIHSPPHLFSPDSPHTPSSDHLLAPESPFAASSNLAVLSLPSVVGEKADYKLQNVSPFFTDPNKVYMNIFESKLEKLDGKTSEDQLCIEEYLVKSEKAWYGKMRAAEMGQSPATSVFRMKRLPTPNGSIFEEGRLSSDRGSLADEFLLGDDYAPPTGVKRILRLRIGDWPLYSILLAFGQVIAANSYQITLLTGQVGQPASKLYVVASIYLVTSVMWWLLYRRLMTVYVLSLPFLFYGLAFLFIGIAPFGPNIVGRGWLQNVATAWYAIASSSGSIFFAVNFGDEGGAPITAWVYRACVIQGSQQIYVVALWFWGSTLTKSTTPSSSGSHASTPGSTIISIVGFVVAILMWVVGTVLFIGLPKYYRQSPGKMPSFYMSLFRRKIIIWFFVVIAIQNYFLSAPYGRNWLYLFSSQHVPAYAIFLLVLLFFVFIWAAFLYLFARLSTSHSWILPIFAIGLGAPRWAQMLWGTSNIGQYVPWAGGPAASAVVGRSLWLWLGVLDALQGVGFGMILLQTLTRFHVLFTLLAAQVIGSIATILARATAPNKLGPGDVFPDFSAGAGEGLGKPWFWIALLANLAVPVGFFMFFRKEQLSKP